MRFDGFLNNLHMRNYSRLSIVFPFTLEVRLLRKVSYCMSTHMKIAVFHPISILCFLLLQCVFIPFILYIDTALGFCTNNEHQRPISIYAFSSNPMKGVSFKIGTVQGSTDIVYYNSDDELFNRLEFIKIICVDKYVETAYQIIVNTYTLVHSCVILSEERLEQDVEIAAFSSPEVSQFDMQVKIWIPRMTSPSVIKSYFSGSGLFRLIIHS